MNPISSSILGSSATLFISPRSSSNDIIPHMSATGPAPLKACFSLESLNSSPHSVAIILYFHQKSMHSITSTDSSYKFSHSVGICVVEGTKRPCSFKVSSNLVILQILLVFSNNSTIVWTTSIRLTSSVGTTNLSESRTHFRASKNSVLNL